MTIVYAVIKPSHVTVRIVNSYNTTVATLVDTTQQEGSYRLTWNTEKYPAGVYFYYFSEVSTAGDTTMQAVTRFLIGG